MALVPGHDLTTLFGGPLSPQLCWSIQSVQSVQYFHLRVWWCVFESSFLGVFMSYLGIHQGFGLRGRRGPPPIANVEPQVLHSLVHELTLLQLESGVVLLADRKELTQED